MTEGNGHLDPRIQEAIRVAAKATSEQYGPDQYVSISMAVLGALRNLPVEQRMEAMGMMAVYIDRDGDPYLADGVVRLPSSVLDDLWTTDQEAK